MSYLERLLALYKNPKHYGKLKDSLMGEEHSPSCGDRIKVYVKLKEGKIEDASFEGSGCVISITSTSLLLDRIIGKPLKDIPSEEEFLKTLPVDLSKNPQRVKCALAGYRALKKALMAGKEGVKEAE